MVDRSYLTEKRPAPSRARRVVTQRLIPLLVDGAGAVEVRLELAAGAVRRSPARTLLTGVLGGYLLGWLLGPRRR